MFFSPLRYNNVNQTRSTGRHRVAPNPSVVDPSPSSSPATATVRLSHGGGEPCPRRGWDQSFFAPHEGAWNRDDGTCAFVASSSSGMVVECFGYETEDLGTRWSSLIFACVYLGLRRVLQKAAGLTRRLCMWLWRSVVVVVGSDQREAVGGCVPGMLYGGMQWRSHPLAV